METLDNIERLQQRDAPIEMTAEEFRAAGHALVDRIAEFMASLPDRPVSPGESPAQVRALLPEGSLPEHGTGAESLLEEAAQLLFDHSTFNGHPRFLGYITASAAPIGVLADLLAAAVNPNVGGFVLSPIATEIEKQTVRWIAEMIGYPTGCGGLLVSGGNMANFVGFLAARRAKAPWDVRAAGMSGGQGRMRLYTSQETHTWVQKAADLFGLGTDSIRWIATDDGLRMDTAALRKAIEEDKVRGDLPFLVIGTAGSTSTGAIDPLVEIAAICREHDLWFHIDGAYGGFAAVLPDAPPDLKALGLADSIAVDPHKWLYSPLEAGCALVRDPDALVDAFTYDPPYYHLPAMGEEVPTNFYKLGPQNSRGFRALKVWLALRQVGREGYARMISDDIRLTEELFRLVSDDPELEPFTQGLSICTFRYVPRDLDRDTEGAEEYLNDLNNRIVTHLETGPEAFVSNTVINGKYLLRPCIVNFRTSLEDVRALPVIVTRIGAALDKQMRPAGLKGRG